ncbi:MAG: hypothetical protein ABSB69_12280 [Solirubrobacteraceae bacterium]
MLKLAGTPRVSAVEAMDHDALTDFSCGTEHEWERQLNSMVHMLADSGGPPDTRTYIVEDTSPGAGDAFIGVVAFFHWWPVRRRDPDTSPGGRAMYIQVLGITAGYRKSRVRRDDTLQGRVPEIDGEVPIGAWLLAWTLEEIRSLWPAEQRPVWALVHKENARCHRMLRAQDFERDEPGDVFERWIRGQAMNEQPPKRRRIIERD